MLPVRVDKLIDEILTYLFTAEWRRLDGWITRLVRDNQEAYRDSSLQGFVHNGEVYKPANLQLATTAIKRRGLHPSLNENMEAYTRDYTVLCHDKALISQSLFRLLDPCQTLEDVRNTLPECLAGSLEYIANLARTGTEAFTLMDDNRARRQYEKIRVRIELYVATRMLY